VQIEHAVFAGFCAVWLAFVVVNFTNERQYHVGECVMLDAHYETWEKQYVRRIVEVGERNYRASVWMIDHWGVSDITQPFEAPYKHVPCPEEPS
jgi:hypothetical protein